ncbi:GNAT family N-acetyltransferase [Cellulomonas sp.]|uniref:GNAT family N-acetyltransferase n=1 Tax=Cellulomonas sp. TaxID=40001 RepID=UPI001B1BF95B|nr:GNAT family N-acetyltransferase [Cellulomonas sp.]MBO9555093.1 GNAT family N-acetyltransferase [Cellulomonas sp.]
MLVPDGLSVTTTTGEVALLRPVAEDDWRLDQELSRVPDVTRWTYYPPDVAEEEARRRVARNLEIRAAGRGGRYIIVAGDSAVGTIGVGTRGSGPFLFYALLPVARGRGLAIAAVSGLAGWLLAHGEPFVAASTMVGNTASERVLTRAGFEPGELDVEPDGVTVRRWRLGAPP